MKKFIKKEVDTFTRRVKRKGQEPLTIMLIPHGRERIFSLHLTWLMILFLSGILLTAIFLGGYAVYLQNQKSVEVQRLKDYYGANYGATLNLHRTIHNITRQNEELFDRLETIAESSGFSADDFEVFNDLDQSEERADTQLFAEILNTVNFRPGFDYMPTVYSIRALHNYARDKASLYRSLQESLGRGGIGIYTFMPMGRPLHMSGSLHDTSGFGIRPDPVTKTGLEFHNGFDTSGPAGTPVYATASGVVHRILRNDSGYGNAVIVQHKFGYYSLFAHLQAVQVRTGMDVHKGFQIGIMGRTGRVTGTHLHYEVWLGNQNRINPLSFICSIDFETQLCKKYHKSI